MSRPPRSITVIGWLFVAVGCFGIVGHTWPLMAPRASTDVRKTAAARRSGVSAFEEER